MGSSSGGGDGGAAERKASEDLRQKEAIAKLNASFGYGTKKAAPSRSDFMRSEQAPNGGFGTAGFKNPQAEYVPEFVDVFDQSGFDSALAESEASGADLSGLAERKALYGRIASDSRQLQLDDLTKQKDVASRETEFDLARRGLTGGSRQIDATRDIGDQFNKGVLQAETQAQGVANTAEAADEKTRISLINGIRGGMDQADAVSGALNAMSNSAAAAQNDAKKQNVSGFFDEIRAQAQRQQDANMYQQQFNKYKNGGGSSGAGVNGTIQNNVS